MLSCWRDGRKERERNNMKFKKVPNSYLFSKYIREDGAYIIESEDIKINGHWKNVFTVKDRDGNLIDTLSRLKDAKAKYSDM